jgi:phosphoribosylformylglycinamidine cyclo-ligase
MASSMTQAKGSGDRYRAAGVDIAAGNALVERLKPLAGTTIRRGSLSALGGFGAVFDLAAEGYRDPLLVATTDGVGTKVLIGLRSGRIRGLGIDLVAMCVNDLVVQGAEPLFFLDYFATGRLEAGTAIAVLEGIAEGCAAVGCALVGGETAEMPGLYGPGHFDLAGFAVGAVERDALLPRPTVVPGDRLLGLASSGVHSNGFALVRRIVEDTAADLGGPAPFDADISLGEALLAPTRLYVRSCLGAARAGLVKAMAHITGGGLVENVPRALPRGCIARIDVRRWPLPGIFHWLQETGGLGPLQLARTFNAGIGMVVITAAESVGDLRARLEEAGETVYEIGEVVADPGPPRVDLIGIETAWRRDA